MCIQLISYIVFNLHGIHNKYIWIGYCFLCGIYITYMIGMTYMILHIKMNNSAATSAL